MLLNTALCSLQTSASFFKQVKYGIFGARFTLQQVIILEFHNGYQVFLAKSQVRALRGQIFKA